MLSRIGGLIVSPVVRRRALDLRAAWAFGVSGEGAEVVQQGWP